MALKMVRNPFPGNLPDLHYDRKPEPVLVHGFSLFRKTLEYFFRIERTVGGSI